MMFQTKSNDRERFIALCNNDKFIEAFEIYKKIKNDNESDNAKMLGIAIMNAINSGNILMKVCLLNIDR